MFVSCLDVLQTMILYRHRHTEILNFFLNFLALHSHINGPLSIRSRCSLRLGSQINKLRQVTRQMMGYLSTLSLGIIFFFLVFGPFCLDSVCFGHSCFLGFGPKFVMGIIWLVLVLNFYTCDG